MLLPAFHLRQFGLTIEDSPMAAAWFSRFLCRPSHADKRAFHKRRHGWRYRIFRFRPMVEPLEERLAPSVTWTVTGLGDGTPTVDSINHTSTSLRGAINAAASGDTIQFQSGLSGSID